MNRLLLAVLLVLPAVARADDAYRSLQGMGEAAKTDRGPDAGEIPQGEERLEERGSAARASERVETGRARIEAGRAAAAAARAERERRDEAAGAAAAQTRAFSAYWARVFSRLHRAGEPYSAPVSTATARVAPAFAVR